MRRCVVGLLVGSLSLGTLAAGCRPQPSPRDGHSAPQPTSDTAARTRGAATASTGTLTGVVTDASTGQPVEGVQVFVEGTGYGTATSAAGRYFIIAVPPGTYAVSARRIGYQSMKRTGVRVQAGVARSVDFRLGASTRMLQALTIVAESAPLYEIGTTGSSTTITAEDIQSLPVSAIQSALARQQGFAASSGTTVDLTGADEVVAIAESESMARRRSASPAMSRQETRSAGDAGAYQAVRADGGPESPPPGTQGALHARDAKGKLLGEFPLAHTEVSADVAGYLARTEVEQRYRNTFEQPIEAVYVFPMPAMAAVHDFVMEANGRKIVGVVRPRAEAERIYQDARARGQTASLLTQERSNIFTQNVANIAPGGTVTIRITYIERLAYEHGQYEYVFPMVVGPRYQSGQGAGGATLVGGRRVRDDDEVPTRARDRRPGINPPVLRPGQRSGHDIGLTLTLDAGLPVTALEAVAHRVTVDSETPRRRVVHLAASDSIPNRDFVMRWSVAGAETQFGVLAHRGQAGGFFTLAMQPPAAPRDDQVMPREVTFIMDVSGSMTGVPLDISKDLARRTMERLRPDDKFNIVYFSGANAQLWEQARRGTPENLASAKAFLDGVSAGGGTEMMAGLRRAMGAPHDPEFLQMYIFLTDGYVSEDGEILKVVRTERGDARFFGFGIGSSVNRSLIDGIGEHGGGMSFVVMPRDSAAAAVTVGRLFDAIDSPVLADVAIDWNGLPVRDAYPSKLRDLFAGQTINVVGRYDGPARGTAYVTGRVGRRRVRYPVEVDFPAAEPRHAALAPTWARFKIADLTTAMMTADSARQRELEQEITDLAVRHRLVSQYTSFVAVDESRVVGDGRPVRILQPVELPEGVSFKGIFGENAVGRPMRIGAWGLTLQGTERGAVRVGSVTLEGPAARAGIKPGATIEAVNRTTVRDLAQLESLLLQSGATVQLGFSGGRTVELRTP